MANKLGSYYLVAGVLLITILGAIAFVLADSHQNELAQLENDLSSSNYSWLVNYSGSDLYPSVGVFREGSDENLAVFENISSGNFSEYKIYLTNLSDSQDTFDLKSLGDIEYDYIVDPTNTWNCTTSQLFSNVSCWSLGTVPVTGDDVLFSSSYNGNCNITNNTMPQDLNSFTVQLGYTGKIYFSSLFAVGSWGSWVGTQQWNVTNNINISGGTMYIYGDAYDSKNINTDGRGQVWKSLNGNITIGASAVINGVGLGFVSATGPGVGGEDFTGATYGGMGGNNRRETYGNASAPVSLGSGGVGGNGGSGIKLDASSGKVNINGRIDISGSETWWGRGEGSGGSIWIVANNLSGNGFVIADGKSNSNNYAYGGGGGRIRFDFSSYSYIGKISVGGGNGGAYNGRPGTFSFSSSLTSENLTYPSDWTLNGTVGLASGNYTILGNLIIPSGTTLGVHPLNWTAANNGTGVYINVTGNITIQSGGSIDGQKEGFKGGYGLGGGYEYSGGTYGGKGSANTKSTYGSEIYPISLGSGGSARWDNGDGAIGGGAIWIYTPQTITINGTIDCSANVLTSSPYASGAGGSILLQAGTISGNGSINANGQVPYGGTYAGGGGRIALHSITNNFVGNISNKGGSANANSGTGGTVYINATSSITSSGNISVVGYNGTQGGGVGTASDNGQRITFTTGLATLSGIYNASNLGTAGTGNGSINVSYSNCASSFTGTFIPNATLIASCTSDTTYPQFSNYWDNNATLTDSGTGLFNVTLLNTNGTVLLEINGTNITATNLSSNIYNASKVFTIAGTYPYKWHSWGNGSNHLYNNSDTINYSFDVTQPFINFTGSTPSAGSNQSSTTIPVEVNAIDTNNISTFIDLDNSLVSWWRMDDLNATDVVDYMGRNNGTIVGSATQTASGKMGKAFSFDGHDGQINISDSSSLDLINNFAISFWIKPMDLSQSSRYILSKLGTDDNAYAFIWEYIDNNIEFYSSSYIGDNPRTNSGIGLGDTNWHHIVYMYNGSLWEGYIDGGNVFSLDKTFSLTSSTGDLFLGTFGGAGDCNHSGCVFGGSLDDIMIFNRSLSSSEIAALYANTSTKYLINNFTSLTNGNHTFKAYAQDSAGNVNNTEIRSVTIESSSCTCPSLNTNWQINMADNCVITSTCNLGIGNITFSGIGNATFNSTLTTKNIENLSSGQTMYVGSSAIITVG